MHAFTLFIVLLTVCACTHGLTVETTISKPKANIGEDVVFTCKIKDDKDNSVVEIRKALLFGDRDEDGNERYEDETLTTNTVIHGKYENTGRFSIETKDDGPWKYYELSIRNINIQDSGYYVCVHVSEEIHNFKLLEVFKMPDMISFDNYTDDGVSSRDVVVFSEGETKKMACMLDEVMPIPEVRVRVDNVSYTDYFRMKYYKTVVPTCHNVNDDTQCLLHYYYSVSVYADELELPYTEDHKDLVCEAVLPGSGLEPVSVKLPIAVKHTPKFDCDIHQRESLGNGGSIKCIIQANPTLDMTQTNFAFTMDEQSTTLHKGEVYMEGSAEEIRMTLKELTANQWEAILTFAKVQEKHYETYVLTAFNELGQNSMDIAMVGIDFVYNSSQPLWSSVLLTISAILTACILKK